MTISDPLPPIPVAPNRGKRLRNIARIAERIVADEDVRISADRGRDGEMTVGAHSRIGQLLRFGNIRIITNRGGDPAGVVNRCVRNVFQFLGEQAALDAGYEDTGRRRGDVVGGNNVSEQLRDRTPDLRLDGATYLPIKQCLIDQTVRSTQNTNSAPSSIGIDVSALGSIDVDVELSNKLSQSAQTISIMPVDRRLKHDYPSGSVAMRFIKRLRHNGFQSAATIARSSLSILSAKPKFPISTVSWAVSTLRSAGASGRIRAFFD